MSQPFLLPYNLKYNFLWYIWQKLEYNTLQRSSVSSNPCMIMWSPNDPTFMLISTLNSKQSIKKTVTICLLGRVNKHKQTMESQAWGGNNMGVSFQGLSPFLGSIWPWTTAAESPTVCVSGSSSNYREQGKEHGWAAGEGKQKARERSLNSGD